MALKTNLIVLNDSNEIVKFRVKQMPLVRLELFTLKLLALLAASAKDMPTFNGLADGLEWLKNQSVNALLSCLGHLDTDKAAPLLDELLGCCYHVVGQVETKCAPDNIDQYLSGIGSLFALRKAAFTLNFSFFTEGAAKLYGSQKKERGKPPPTTPDTPTMPTSAA
jgi:hypothetical protein